MTLDYTMMRQFADSWGLVAMVVFFAAAVALAIRPSSNTLHEDAASIPFKEDK